MKLTGAFILLVLLMTSAAKFERNALLIIVPREVAQASSSGQESKSFDYENIRVTVTKLGIVAGDLQSGKVIWRREFNPSPKEFVLVGNVIFFGKYFYYEAARSTGFIGVFVNTKNGKQVTYGYGFYLKSGENYYLNKFDPSYNYDVRGFDFVAIQEFNSITHAIRNRVFEFSSQDPSRSDFDRFCVDFGSLQQDFTFKSMQNNIWTFVNSRDKDRKCDIAASFDFNNPKYFKFSTKRRI